MAKGKEFESYAKSIFDEFDTDESGFIEVKEFEAALRKLNAVVDEKMTETQIKQEAANMVAAMDKNADGKVSYQEFFDRLRFLSH